MYLKCIIFMLLCVNHMCTSYSSRLSYVNCLCNFEYKCMCATYTPMHAHIGGWACQRLALETHRVLRLDIRAGLHEGLYPGDVACFGHLMQGVLPSSWNRFRV